jgi:Spy/CpxP family protein refolding chaperone
MNTSKYNRTLIGIIVILIATNISTVGSFYYHRFNENKTTEEKEENQTSIPGDQRTRFFREELGLNDEQLIPFREVNRTFNRTARGIEMDLAQLREELITELGTENPDSTKLDQLANDIGENHKNLKKVTATFYLNMKNICTDEQKVKLHNIFQSMLNKDIQINLPQQGRQGGRWQNN